jgi:hypothetical protein
MKGSLHEVAMPLSQLRQFPPMTAASPFASSQLKSNPLADAIFRISARPDTRARHRKQLTQLSE